MKKLLIRCDDFGSATGANEAYYRIAETGLKFNASILICGPAAGKETLEKLVRVGPQVALGIHAAINSEWETLKWGPVSDLQRAKATQLTDANGHFHPNQDIVKNTPAEVVLEEIRAQIERGLSWGIPFSYLDEHMGFSWVHKLQEPLGALAREYGLVYRPDVARLETGKTNQGLIADYKVGLDAIDDRPHIVVTHPVIDDASTREYYKAPNKPGVVSRERQVEFDALSSKEWRDTLAQEKIELITYRDLAV